MRLLNLNDYYSFNTNEIYTRIIITMLNRYNKILLRLKFISQIE